MTSSKPVCTYSILFFNDTATTEIYTLSLHDALPISPSVTTSMPASSCSFSHSSVASRFARSSSAPDVRDRKSTRLNSSHTVISYAVFCLKKKRTYNGQHKNEKVCIRRHNEAWNTVSL